MSNKVETEAMEHKTTSLTARQVRDTGTLLEINRQFLHPLGLCLGVTMEQDGSDLDQPARLSLSQTDDPEGFVYGRKNERVDKAALFAEFSLPKRNQRFASLGYIEQPLSAIREDADENP